MSASRKQTSHTAERAKASAKDSSVRVVKKVPKETHTRATRCAALANDAIHTDLSWEALTGRPHSSIKQQFPDISDHIPIWLNLFYHPRCGGNPQAFIGNSIYCSGCNYTFPSSSNEPLGSILMRSEFLTKRDNPTFIY